VIWIMPRIREEPGFIGKRFTKLAINSHEKAAKYARGVKELLNEEEVRKALVAMPEQRDKAQKKIVSRLKHYVTPGVYLASSEVGPLKTKYGKAYPVSACFKGSAQEFGAATIGLAVLRQFGVAFVASGALLHLIGRTNTPHVEAVQSEFRKTMKIAKSKKHTPTEREQLLDATIAHLGNQVSAHEHYVEKARLLLREKQAKRK
jgi:hypothetical protein